MSIKNKRIVMEKLRHKEDIRCAENIARNVEIRISLSGSILNINGVYSPIKRQVDRTDFKNNLNICCP